MIKIIQDITDMDYSQPSQTVLKSSTVQKAVQNAISAIITELPEESCTVEAVEYVISEMKQALKEKLLSFGEGMAFMKEKQKKELVTNQN